MFKILLPVIFILGSIGGFVFYVNPAYKTAKLNNEKLASINDALDKANQLSDLRDKLADERKKISPEDLDRIVKMVPDSVENIALIIYLNNIARDKGMDLLNPSFGGGPSDASGQQAAVGAATTPSGLNIGPDGKSHGSMTLSFGVNTTYEKFIDFLKELERSLRLVEIKEVNFSAPNPDTGRTTFNVTLETYWLK